MSAIVTPLAVLSFPAFFEKKPVSKQPGADLKFQGAFIFTKETLQDPQERALFEAMVKAIDAAGVAKFGARYEELKPSMKANKKYPLRPTSDSDYIPDELDGFFFNARSDFQPTLVTEIPDAEGKPSLLTDPSKIYAGTIGRALVTFYGYDNVSKGVGVGLEGFQWVRDGESLVNRVDAQEVFAVNPNAPKADLGDIVPASAGAEEDDLQGLI